MILPKIYTHRQSITYQRTSYLFLASLVSVRSFLRKSFKFEFKKQYYFDIGSNSLHWDRSYRPRGSHTANYMRFSK